MSHSLLLADDSVTIRRVIELTFADERVRVVSVSSGREALERIAADKPDIVLADIGMADVSGYDIAAFIKGRPDLRHIPVVLLAGAFEPLDEAKARQAGSDAVLIKPFEPQLVVARVRELLARPAAPPPPVPAPAPAPARPAAQAAQHVPAAPAFVPEQPRAASSPTGGDPLFNESLDRLDAAFAGTNGPSLTADVVSDFAKDLKQLRAGRESGLADTGLSHTAFARDDFGDWDLPSRTAPAVVEDDGFAAFDMGAARASEPIAEPPRTIAPPPTPMTLPPPVTLQPKTEPVRTIAPPPQPRPSVAAAPARPAPATAAAPAVPLADAFSSLLAAEEARPVQPSPGYTPAASASLAVQPSELSDEAVDQIVDKVVARLGAGVRGAVLDLAERLVRAEIDRLKAMR